MTFPVYTNYKGCEDQWINQIPKHWETCPIKTISEIDNSGFYGEEQDELMSNFPVATTAQIDKNGRFSIEEMPIRSFENDASAKYLCEEGDILVVKSSGSATNIISGKAGIVRAEDSPFIFSNFLMRLKADKKKILPKFLYSFIRSNITKQRVNLMCSSTTYPNLKVGEYISAHITLPPINEQKYIVKFLDHETTKIDALITEQERLIELLQEKRQAVISHAVTKGLSPNATMKDSGVEWLGEVPEHWEVMPIKRLASMRGGYAFSSDLFSPEGVQLIRIGNLYQNQLDLDRQPVFIEDGLKSEFEEFLIRERDILISLTGTLGKQDYGYAIIAEGKEELLLNQRVGSLRKTNENIDEKLLLFSMRSDSFLATLYSKPSGTKQANLSNSDILSIKITVPKDRKEQQEIIEHIDKEMAKIEKLIEHSNSLISLLSERRSALISAAITGQIDVRGLFPEEVTA